MLKLATFFFSLIQRGAKAEELYAIALLVSKSSLGGWCAFTCSEHKASDPPLVGSRVLLPDNPMRKTRCYSFQRPAWLRLTSSSMS